MPKITTYMPQARCSYPPRGAAALALALFLTGTNYCLVGMIAGSVGGGRVSCMAMAAPATGSCHEAPRASHCGGAKAPARDDAAPGRTGVAPCCVPLAPVLAMSGMKIVAADLGPVLPVAIADADLAPAPAQGLRPRVFRDEGPPPLHPRAPLASRAPPLA